ncbi:MAG: cache domain-containing protein [Acidobacteriota bacterium]
MPVPEDPATGTARPRAATAPRYLQALKVPLGLAFIAATAMMAYYWVYVQREADYLTTRNFRKLAMIAHQLEEEFKSVTVVLRSLRPLADPRDPGKTPRSIKDDLALARGSTPILSLVSDLPTLYGNAMLVPALRDSTGVGWMWTSPPPGENDYRVHIPLDGAFERLLAPFARKDLFESVLLVSTSGRVLLQSGDRTLQLTSLANLLQTREDLSGKTPEARLPAEVVARSANAFDVVIANKAYTIFLVPCCAAVATDSEVAGAKSEQGWLVAGLVSKSNLRTASLSVSFSAMALLTGLLLLAVFSYPFVKLTLIGRLQRVPFHDVVLLGFCTIFGGALVTIAGLDFYGYGKLKANLDGQLEAYAGTIVTNVRTELDAVAAQLDLLERAGARLQHMGAEIPNLAGLAKAVDVDLSRYPLFETFSLIDRSGMQKLKGSLGVFVPPRVSVARREYFNHWQIPRPNERRFVESIRSLTTGKHEIVVSKPGRTPALPVAAVATQQFRSLIDTVSIPGFTFAIVNRQGDLLFHSQAEHDAAENVFAETDGNRRLRALIDARQRGWLNLQYGGDDYRAYASPMALEDVPDWSLITFFDKQLARTLNIDWLILTTLFVIIYAGVYLAVLVAVCFTRPTYRAPWIWPSEDRSATYLKIAMVLVILIGGWVAGFALLSNAGLLWTAWLLPFLAWTIAYGLLAPAAGHRRTFAALVGAAILAVWVVAVRDLAVASIVSGATAVAVVASRRKADLVTSSTRLPVTRLCYGLAGTAIALSTVVLPAASFYRVAHTIQAANLVKYGQLKLALAVSDRAVRSKVVLDRQVQVGVTRLQPARDDFDRLGVYHSFFFETRPAPATVAGTCHPNAPTDDDVPEGLEELLPFYSESSVGLRELTHDRAYDQRWQWCERDADGNGAADGDGWLLMNLRPAAGDVRYESRLPVLLESTPQWPWFTEGLSILLVGLLIGGVTVWAVRFVMERIFLIDLIDPLWSPRTTGPVSSGANLLMVTRAPLVAPFFQLENYAVVDLGAAGTTDAELEEWERNAHTSLDAAEEWKNVLVLQVDRAATDRRLKISTLRLVEFAADTLNRTVLMVSARPLSVLERRDGTAGADAESETRWIRLLAKFVAVPAGAAEAGRIAPPDWAAPNGGNRLGTMLWRSSMGFLDDEANDAYVMHTWRMLVPSAPTPLDASQLLVEADERLDRYYQRIWAACSPDEQLVLLQIAEEGLCNAKSIRVVRRLMARGLVTRRRNIRLVSETFRRFVLSDGVRSDAAALEGRSASAWDDVRIPFMAMVVATMAFFFTTQHELFNTTLGIVTGVAAGVPTVLKLATLFGEKRSTST